MSSTVNTRIKLKRDTTANWNAARGFRPLAGEVIIYTDYQSYSAEEYGETVTKYIPGIKIGDGSTYVQDLPFVDKDLRDKLMDHINNMEIHVTLAEKAFWNNKLNVNDLAEVEDDSLIFNRN